MQASIEWAPEGEQKAFFSEYVRRRENFVIKQAYVSMPRAGEQVAKPGGTAGVITTLVPAEVWDESVFFCTPSLQMLILKGEKKMADKKIPYKIYLTEEEMPKEWYNVRADMKIKPAPLLNPETLKPLTAEEL